MSEQPASKPDSQLYTGKTGTCQRAQGKAQEGSRASQRAKGSAKQLMSFWLVIPSQLCELFPASELLPDLCLLSYPDREHGNPFLSLKIVERTTHHATHWQHVLREQNEVWRFKLGLTTCNESTLTPVFSPVPLMIIFWMSKIKGNKNHHLYLGRT